MSDIVISCEQLGKRYKIGAKLTRRTIAESLSEQTQELRRRVAAMCRRDELASESRRMIWALEDVTFQVEEGEVLGIIGPNGAGKSTLLKVLSRITHPTRGWARIRGRVGSVLDVGTGFHPELTGRENVFLNGAVLGMKRHEIAAKFDDIVEFSGVAPFLDTPVKRYSSGMYLRLAFSVAAHLNPEILIMDEVLAVGDAAFQRKCLDKTGDFARAGRTVLFVSHNMTAIQSLCRRVLWIDRGRIVADGRPAEVVAQYLRSSLQTRNEQIWPDRETAPGSEQVRIRRVAAYAAQSASPDEITTETGVRLVVEFWNRTPGARLSISLHIYTEDGTLAFAAVPVEESYWSGREYPAGLFRDTCTIPGNFLNDGIHRVDVFVLEEETRIVCHHPEAILFSVADGPKLRGAYYGKWPGVVRPVFQWETELVEQNEQQQTLTRPGTGT